MGLMPAASSRPHYLAEVARKPPKRTAVMPLVRACLSSTRKSIHPRGSLPQNEAMQGAPLGCPRPPTYAPDLCALYGLLQHTACTDRTTPHHTYGAAPQHCKVVSVLARPLYHHVSHQHHQQALPCHRSSLPAAARCHQAARPHQRGAILTCTAAQCSRDKNLYLPRGA